VDDEAALGEGAGDLQAKPPSGAGYEGRGHGRSIERGQASGAAPKATLKRSHQMTAVPNRSRSTPAGIV
jgi:hypothetical protein